MVRFYLVPLESTATARGPKYFRFAGDPDAPALIQAGWTGRPYGSEPLMLIAANLTDPEDASLSAQIDVTKFADDLDTQLGAGLAAMQIALEATNLPAEMLTSGMTYRTVIRGIMGIHRVAQCMRGKGFRIFAGAVTLPTTLNSLPVAARTALSECATSLGYDQTGITGASTIRQMLAKIVQQAAPSRMLGVEV